MVVFLRFKSEALSGVCIFGNGLQNGFEFQQKA